jgi:hypothetical protein
MIQTKHREDNYTEVMTWLSAHDAISDQESAAKIRREHPLTGLWLLQERQVKTWLDPQTSLVLMLWMNGKPGAGCEFLSSSFFET